VLSFSSEGFSPSIEVKKIRVSPREGSGPAGLLPARARCENKRFDDGYAGDEADALALGIHVTVVAEVSKTTEGGAAVRIAASAVCPGKGIDDFTTPAGSRREEARRS